MSHRSSIAVALVVALVSAPASARAEEQEQEPAVVTSVLPALPVTPSPIMLAARPSSTTLAYLVPSPTEIRLSHRARTAIIVTAIVVGSLLLIGTVVVVSNKHVGP